MSCSKLTTRTLDHCAEYCLERPQQAISVSFEQTEHNIQQTNPFPTTVLLVYPLKTSENFWISDVFKGAKKEKSDMK